MKGGRTVLAALAALVLTACTQAAAVPDARGRVAAPGARALPAGAETLAAAIAAGKVSVVFRGNGGSSGDAIEAVVTRTDKAGPGELVLTVPPGTRLVSADVAAQSMVVARVRGRMVDAERFAPDGDIRLAGREPATYLLEAYCAEFEKENPSGQTTFSLGPADPVIACIVGQPGERRFQTIQAAVWIVTGKVTYAAMNQKFPVTKDEWAAAEAMVRACMPPGAGGR